MSNQIILKKSSVAAKVPLSTDLAYGELALNYADGIIYYKNSAGTIASISGSGGGGTSTPTVSNNVSANGSTQLTGTALTSDINIINNITTGTAVKLPVPTAGKRIVVINRAASAIVVFPSSSTQIDSLGNDISISIPQNGLMEFNGATSTQWYSTYNFTTASSGGGGAVNLANETYSTSSSVSASGITQASGTLLSSDYNIVTTASITANSVVLPAPSVGKRVTVINRSNYGIEVYPSLGNTIDTLSVNVPIGMPLYGSVEFIGASSTNWFMTFTDNNSSAAATSDYTLYSRVDTLYSYQGQTIVNTTYTPGNVQVFLNGVLLKSTGSAPDYSEEPTGKILTFTTALTAGQEIDVITYNTGQVKNTIGVNMALTQFFDFF